jgi:hypothetical protein
MSLLPRRPTIAATMAVSLFLDISAPGQRRLPWGSVCPPDIGPTRIRRAMGAIPDTQAGCEVLSCRGGSRCDARVFVQCDFAKKSAGEGTRLGLSMNHDIIVK